MNPAEKDLPQDLLVDGLLEEALADYQGLVPDDVLEEIRSSLGDLLYAHPEGQRILRQLESDPVVSGSGDIDRPDEQSNLEKPQDLRPKKAQS